MDMIKVIDVTLPLQEPMRGFRKSVAKTLDEDGWNATTLEIYSHAGTHMDAPLHFGVSEDSIDQVPPERLILRCHMVRIDSCQPSALITEAHLADVSGRVLAGDGIIFHTGWSRYEKDPAIYRDQLPRISRELAFWLVEKQVGLIGVEPPSIADVNNLGELQEVHRILLEGDVLILEGLCNLEQVQADLVQLIALPLKVQGGDGAPVRAVIVENQLI